MPSPATPRVPWRRRFAQLRVTATDARPWAKRAAGLVRLARAGAAFAIGVDATAGCSRESADTHTAPLRIAAASDLAGAFEEIAKAYERVHGHNVSLSFGASGRFADQLTHGAPYDLFAAADESYVAQVTRAGVCDPRTRLRYALGSLVLWTRADSSPLTLEQLVSPAVRRIALANPDHAPYGRAARESLVTYGLWARLASKIVFADNVRQAFQFAETGNADAAIVSRSLAHESAGHATPIDPDSHRPLVQELVVCAEGARGHDARTFASFVESTAGQDVLRKFGFARPPSDPSPSH